MSIAFSEDGFETEEALVTTSLTRDDENEGSLRPKTLNEYIGQAKAKGNLLTVRVNDIGGNGGMYQGPVLISTQKPMSGKGWTTPYPAGSDRDYSYNPDIVRGY